MYIDQGLEKVEKFLEMVIYPKVVSGTFSHEMDYKTRLQEVLQRSGDRIIDYRLVKEEGPAHERLFFGLKYIVMTN